MLLDERMEPSTSPVEGLLISGSDEEQLEDEPNFEDPLEDDDLGKCFNHTIVMFIWKFRSLSALISARISILDDYSDADLIETLDKTRQVRRVKG